VTGIGTGVGKTVASAWLCHHLKAKYWKPVQSGLEDPTDTQAVCRMAQLTPERVIPEAYRLQLPASPHLSAAAEQVRIEESKLAIPFHQGSNLIIEGAGGLLVPLRDDLLYADMVAKWGIPAILVVQTYLGSINHSLLSLEALKSRNIPVAGIVLNEGDQPASENIILDRAQAPLLGRIPWMKEVEFQHLANLPMLSQPNYLKG